MLFSVSFTEILMSYGSSVRSWTLEPGTPTDSTGTPEHRKNHLDEVQAGFGTTTHQDEHMCYLNVLHDPSSRNCAILVLYTVSIVLSFTSRL